MIPNDVLAFMATPTFFAAATRDEALQPAISRVVAWAHPDRERITVLWPALNDPRALANLRANGRVAVNMGGPLGPDSYQLKGRVEAIHAPTAEDLARLDAYIERMEAGMAPTGMYPPKVFHAIAFTPCEAVEVRVEEVYLQTPGPGAGSRLDLAAAAQEAP